MEEEFWALFRFTQMLANDVAKLSVRDAFGYWIVSGMIAIIVARCFILLSRRILSSLFLYGRKFVGQKKIEAIANEWGRWRRRGLPKESVHALAYCLAGLVVTKFGFDFARALSLPVTLWQEAALSAGIVLLSLGYGAWQIKTTHKGNWQVLGQQFIVPVVSAMIALHYSDIVRPMIQGLADVSTHIGSELSSI